jgi:hypothetical protein
MSYIVQGQQIPSNVAILFIGVAGLVFLLKPEWILQLKVWEQKTFMGAKYAPSKNTEWIMRFAGAIFIALAVWLAFYGASS